MEKHAMQARKRVVMGCARSAGVAMQKLLTTGWSLPDDVEWVEMPCASAIDELHMVRAFESGAEYVLVLSCHQGACRSLEGDQRLANRVKAVQSLLAEIGIDPSAVAHQRMAPNMASDLRAWITSLGAPQPCLANEQDAGEA